MHVRKVSALILGFNPFAPLAPVFDQLVMGLHQGLDAINVVTHNYGWSLVLLAILVRGVVFLPLNAMQFKSMSRMQELQPKIKALQAKYKSKDSETAQKLNAEVMALYKEHNVNPLAGCLPLVLQMPILIALYYAIIKDNDKFAGATWLWIGSPLSHQFPQILATNLAQSDLVLLALYIVSMYFSVRFASPATDPAQAQQQKIMAFVSPALIGYIPSGRSPLHFALSAFGQYLYVSDSGAAQIQVVNVSTLPALTG